MDSVFRSISLFQRNKLKNYADMTCFVFGDLRLILRTYKIALRTSLNSTFLLGPALAEVLLD